jgi:lysozyme family protein
MAQDNFINCLQLTLHFEGGYVKNPFDPGGATNKGITLRTFSAYKGRTAARAELLSLSDQDVQNIYKQMFWAPLRGDDLPSGLDAALFDYAVNSGPRRALISLQNILNLRPTGMADDHVLAMINELPPAALISALSQHRTAFMQRLRNFATFKKGWLTRVKQVETAALAMSAHEYLRKE